jgi:SAM-dependent methyltransferase
MSAVDFEDLYRLDPDPWSYESSEYERQKYEKTLAACGPGPFAHALELGASIGVFSAMLATRCARLTTIDFAPTAVLAARARLQGFAHVSVIQGRIPDAIPQEPSDLVVASEILYYLEPEALALTLEAMARRLAPRGRLVAVHWRRPGPERPASATDVHSVLSSQPWLTSLCRERGGDYLLDVMERST